MESIVLETSLGDIQLELYWNHAPRVSFPISGLATFAHPSIALREQ